MIQSKFRFEYLRVGKSIRTDRQIQIFTRQGHIVGHIEASFGEWLLKVLLSTAEISDRDTKMLIESLDDAISNCKKHRRSIRDYAEGGEAWYEKSIHQKP